MNNIVFNSVVKRILKIAFWVILAFNLLLLLLWFLLRFQAVQNFIFSKAAQYYQSETGHNLTFSFVGIKIPAGLEIIDLYVEDNNNDTLLFCHELSTEISFLKLLSGKLDLGEIKINGLTGKIIKYENDSVFNFSYIINSFSGKSEQPDSTKGESSFEVTASKVNLSDIRFMFEDKASRTLFATDFEKLSIPVNEIDLNKNSYSAGVLTLENCNSLFEINKASVDSGEESNSELPEINIDGIRIINTQFVYKNNPESAYMEIKSGNVEVIPALTDLNLNNYVVKSIVINDASFISQTKAKVNSSSDSSNVSPEIVSRLSDVIPVSVHLNEFKITNTQVSLRNGTSLNNQYFDPQNFDMMLRNIDLEKIQIDTNRVYLKVNSIALADNSGLEIKNLQTSLGITSEKVFINDLRLLTPASNLRFSLSASFKDFKELQEHPDKTEFLLSLKRSTIDLKEVARSNKNLYNNQELKKIDKIVFNAELDGGGGDIFIRELYAGISDNSGIDVRGKLQNISNIDSTYFNFNINRLALVASDLNGLIDEKNIKLPGKLTCGGNIQGTTTDMDFMLSLVSSDGNASTFGNIKDVLGKDKKGSAFMNIKDLNIGSVLGNPDIGKLTASTEINTVIYSNNKVYADAAFYIKEFGFNEYVYKDVKGMVNIKDQLNVVSISSADRNLQFALNASINLDEQAPVTEFNFEIAGADLKKLNLSERDLKISGTTSASIAGDLSSDPRGKIKFENFKVIEDNELFHLSDILILADANDSVHLIEISSDPISFHLSSTVPFDSMAMALNAFFNSQMNDSNIANSTTANAIVNFDLTINDSRIFTDLLVPDLNRLEPGTVSGSVNTFTNQFQLNARFPAINYSNIVIDSMYMNISNLESVLGVNLFIASVVYNKYNLKKVEIKSDYKDSHMLTQLSIGSENDMKVFIPIDMSKESDEEGFVVKLMDDVIFNNEKWSTGSDNYLNFKSSSIYAHNFEIFNEKEKFSVTGSNDNQVSDLHIHFRNFQLGNIGKIISTDSVSSFISGELSGDINLSNYIKKNDSVLNLEIVNLFVDSIEVGSLKSDVSYSNSEMNVRTDLTGNYNEIIVEGVLDSTFSNYEFNMDIKKFSVQTLLPFTVQTLFDASGYLSGKINVKAQADILDVNGGIKFNEVNLLTSYTESYFKIDQQTIQFDNHSVQFNTFSVADSKGALMKLSGNVNYSDLSNPAFDLSVKSKGFEMYNKPFSKKDVYYGRLILDSDITIKGDLDFPVVRANIKVDEGSRLGFVVPESQSDVDQFDKDVIFVENDTNETNIMSINKDTILLGKTFGGMDLTSNIELNDKSQIVIHVDPQSGDSLTVSGDAVLSFTIDEGGTMSLTGSYQVSEGSYLLSFQNLVKKRFVLKRGGTINWTGEILDAEINLEAEHTVNAAPLELVSDQVGGLSDADLNAYRQRLPFEILLLMTGNILSPQIEFKIDLPPEEQDALNGTVYAKLNIINADESQVNKQVFALLVLNRFIGDDIFKSESGDGGESLARNSASKILSQQLNNLSAQYVKGVELSFDIQSYNDYSSGEQQGKTEVGVGVKKRFLKDRLIVQISGNFDVEGKHSQQNDYSNIAGDLILEYILTKDGRYKLRAFMKDQYQGIIDGEVRETGVGIIYTKNFNYWRELFKSTKVQE